MTQHNDDPEEFIPLRHIGTYHTAAFQLEKFIDEFAHWLGICERNDDFEHSDECHAAKSAYEHGLILSCAITLEALINYYGKIRSICYRKDLERSMSSLNKWRLYPRLSGDKELGEHILDRIDASFAIRDRIAHPKPKSYRRGDRVKPFFPNHAFFLLNTIHIAARAVNLEKHQSSLWIRSDYEEEERPPPDVFV